MGGFASAIILSMVALLMLVESIERLFSPHSIHYEQALVVADIGLVVNLVSVWLLGDGHAGHRHDHDHDHDSPRDQHHDLNLRAAYVHVLADAATSMLAIIALLGGKFWNWAWLDPLMGIVGAVLVGVWSIGLIRATSRVLLDREMDHDLVAAIREAIESEGQSPASVASRPLPLRLHRRRRVSRAAHGGRLPRATTCARTTGPRHRGSAAGRVTRSQLPRK